MKKLSSMPNHFRTLELPFRKYVSADVRSSFFFEMDDSLANATATNFPDELWEHVLLEPLHVARCPTWSEMVRLKNTFWEKNDVVIQVHPSKANYVNFHPFVLHLWKPKHYDYDMSLVREVTSSIVKERHSSFHSFSSCYLGTRFVAIFGGYRWPTWVEVCREKQRFFGPDCPAIQFNLDPQFDLNGSFLLTLWDATGINLPPKRLV